MNRKALLEWAANHHYPQLVLSQKDVLRAGEVSWQTFVRSRNKKRHLQAWDRIARWNALTKRDEVA